MRGEGGVTGEGRVVGNQSFTLTLTNINSDWVSNASSGLCLFIGVSLSMPHSSDVNGDFL